MAETNSDLLRAGEYPELADALVQRSDAIIARWRKQCREFLPQADVLTIQQLEDDMPLLLGWIASALRSSTTGPLSQLVRRSPSHGGVRFHQKFNLNELLIEYHLLRQVVLEEVGGSLGRELETSENIAINLGLDISLRRATVEFAEHQAEQLKAATESQAKYLAFLSHDLRGGLNGVLLMIEVLRRDLEAAGQFTQSLEDLDTMKHSILDTVGTMERFLHSERLRKGLFVLRPAQLEVKRFISDIASRFGYQAREKGLTVTHEVPADVSIRTDREVLSMILSNLVSNAIKYTAKGAIRITCDECAPGKMPSVTLSVHDQGPGIAPEDLSRLFAPFTRGETHGQEGTGLGLSIARQGAQLLGGKLWAESTIGHGTTFHLQVPSQPETAPPPAAALNS